MQSTFFIEIKIWAMQCALCVIRYNDYLKKRIMLYYYIYKKIIKHSKYDLLDSLESKIDACS